MPSPRAASHRPGLRPDRLLPPVAIALAAVAVWHGALRYDFSQDDFAGLARASGLLPRLVEPWRWVGNQLLFDLLRPFGTASAAAHHAFGLAAHVVCALLLFAFLRRRASDPAAFAGAAVFVSHPALYAALYWFAVTADSLATLFALAALLLVERSDRWRWASVAFYALSLLSKESTLLLPLAAAVVLASEGRPRRAILRDPVLAVLAVLGIAYAVYFAVSAYPRYFVSESAIAPVAAYATGDLAHAVANATTLLGWTVDVGWPWVRRFSDAVDPAELPWAVATTIVWLAGLAWPRLRRRSWLAGGLVYALFLAPVLPLRNHTYHYYLDAPLIGAAWCVAAAFDSIAGAWADRRGTAPSRRGAGVAAARPRASAWIVAGALAALLVANGAALVRRIETMPFPIAGLRADPIVDRALVAARVRAALGAAAPPPGTRIAFWSPASRAGLAPGDTRETYPERNVRSALLDGLAVRVMAPQVREVRFVRAYSPLPEPWWYAVYRPDGSTGIGPAASLEAALRQSEGGDPSTRPR